MSISISVLLFSSSIHREPAHHHRLMQQLNPAPHPAFSVNGGLMNFHGLTRDAHLGCDLLHTQIWAVNQKLFNLRFPLGQFLGIPSAMWALGHQVY